MEATLPGAPDFEGERCRELNEGEALANKAKMIAAHAQSARATLGSYNQTKALERYASYLKEVNRTSLTTIAALHETVVTLKRNRDELGLSDVFSDEAIVEDQVKIYVRDAPSMDAVEFDHIALKDEPRTDTEKMWELLYTAREREFLEHLQRTAVNLRGEFGVPCPTEPSRKEEMDVQLEKMREDAKLGRETATRHFIFSKLREAVYLARSTYKGSPGVAEKVARGEKTQIRALVGYLEERTQGKYEVLGQYFTEGYHMNTLSTDYNFDGDHFLRQHPFKGSEGYIRDVNLGLRLLRATSLYVGDAKSCCGFGTPAVQVQQEKIHRVTGMKNMASFFEALMEGTTALAKLERLTLEGCHLGLEDADALARLLRKSDVKHLDLSETVYWEDSFPFLVDAVGTCTQLLTVDFSEIRFKREVKGCLSGLSCRGKQYEYHYISDENNAELLSALAASKETLIEVRCTGPKPPTPDHPVLGNAAKLAGHAMLTIIASFPRLVSYDFSYTKICPDVISTAVKYVIYNTDIAWARLDGTRSERLVEVPRCCCCTVLGVVRDEPSPTILTELEDRTRKNRAGLDRHLINVVDKMYKKFVASLESDRDRIEREQSEAIKSSQDAVRQKEAADHRLKCELAAAGASRTTVRQSVPLANVFTHPGVAESGSPEDLHGHVLAIEDNDEPAKSP